MTISCCPHKIVEYLQKSITNLRNIYFAPFRCRVFEPSASCCVAKFSLLVNPSYIAGRPVWLSGCLTPYYPHSFFLSKMSRGSVNLFGQDLQVVVDFFCSPFFGSLGPCQLNSNSNSADKSINRFLATDLSSVTLMCCE